MVVFLKFNVTSPAYTLGRMVNEPLILGNKVLIYFTYSNSINNNRPLNPLMLVYLLNQ